MKRSIVWTCVKAGYGLSIGVMGGFHKPHASRLDKKR